ncbi:MAG: hypothetical protein ACO1OB_10495 [Archangium sp.]
MRLTIAVLVFVVFTGWSITIAIAHGSTGFLALAAREPWAMQMLIDLVLALLVATAWVRSDAKKRGLPWLPYVVLAPILGSPPVLAYIVHREFAATRTPSEPA